MIYMYDIHICRCRLVFVHADLSLSLSLSLPRSLDGWMDGWMDESMDRWTNSKMLASQADRQTDRQIEPDSESHLRLAGRRCHPMHFASPSRNQMMGV